MSLAGPDPFPTNPLRLLAADLRGERRGRGCNWPPGDNRLSVARTRRIVDDPLGMLLEAYERHGPVFSLRILSTRTVFMLGSEANHFVLVSGFENFEWRGGGFSELIPLLGDGLLTIDGPFHRRSRRIMLPVFHRERIAASVAAMEDETARAMSRWADGDRLDLYTWTRALALRIAMRALFGLDPDARRASLDAAAEFEAALSFYGTDYSVRILRGPGSPWRRMHRARARLDALIFGEIERRRRTGERGEDLLSLLLDARDDDGTALTDQHVRDEVMTLLFAGHDTTTSTIVFLFYELARHPQWRARLEGGAPEDLEMAIEETLRLYPPAWVGPRRSVREFEFMGHTIPADVPVNYSSWASHRLPDVWEAPDEFRPERFAPEARKRIPRGAYVPFGGGSRQCIGMRFGQQEIRVIARAILERFRLDPEPGYELRIQQTPTLGPRDGLPVRVRRVTAPGSRP